MRIKQRKAMSMMQVIAKIVIPLLVGAAILTSLQSIKTSTLDPKVNSAESAIDRLGPTTLEIGQGVSSDIARKQMQAAIVYNMLSAADCRLLSATHTFSSLVVDSKSRGDKIIQGDPVRFAYYKYVRNFLTGNGAKPKIKGENRNGYTGRFKSFQPLLSSGQKLSCTGTASAIQNLKQAVGAGTADIVGKFGDAIFTVAAGGIVLASCGTGIGCVAGAVVVGAIAGNTVGQITSNVLNNQLVPNNLGEEPGYDMEGAAGKVLFEVKRTFEMAKTNPVNPLIGLGVKVKNPDAVPNFWQGQRMSYLLPNGLDPRRTGANYMKIYPGPPGGTEKIGGIFRKTSDRGKHKLYAYRPRMVNVPIILEEPKSALVNGMSRASEPAQRLNYFQKKSYYRFCKGASGYIQSNAGSIGNEGEAAQDASKVEQQVYPKVEMRNNANATNCIDTSVPGSWKPIIRSLYRSKSGGNVGNRKLKCGEKVSLGKLGGDEKILPLKCSMGKISGKLQIDGYGKIENPVFAPSTDEYVDAPCLKGEFNVTDSISYEFNGNDTWAQLFLRRYEDETVTVKVGVKNGEALVIYNNDGPTRKNMRKNLRTSSYKNFWRASIINEKSTSGSRSVDSIGVYNDRNQGMTGCSPPVTNPTGNCQEALTPDSDKPMRANITINVNTGDAAIKAWRKGDKGSSVTMSASNVFETRSSSKWITFRTLSFPYFAVDSGVTDTKKSILEATVEGKSVACS